MESLLVAAIVVIALSIAVEAGALIGMYLLSRDVADNVKDVIDEGRKFAPPLERIAANLKSTSDDVASIGRSARLEARQIGQTLDHANDAIRAEIRNVQSTMATIQRSMVGPLRLGAAIWKGINVGIQTYRRYRRKKSGTEERFEERRAA